MVRGGTMSVTMNFLVHNAPELMVAIHYCWHRHDTDLEHKKLHEAEQLHLHACCERRTPERVAQTKFACSENLKSKNQQQRT